MTKLKRNFYYAICFIFCILFVVGCSRLISMIPKKSGITENREEELDSIIYAKIIRIGTTQTDDNGDKVIQFTAKSFGDGISKNITGKQIITKSSNKEKVVSQGDMVILSPQDHDYIFQYYFRLNKIIYLSLGMFIIILIIGKLQGVKTIITLGLTCLSIFYVFIPAIKKGINIYLCTIVICIYIIFETLIIVYGINIKSFIAALGCCIGITFSGILSVIVNLWCKMTGFINEDSYMLSSTLGYRVDLKAIMFSMITIGALGAVMDVSMSITSPLYECHITNTSMTKKDIIHFGMSIGKDFIGTMTNTLILAYIGSSMVVVLMYSASNYPLLSVLNKEVIIFEFLQSIIGCIGILLTVPVTTIICSIFLTKHKFS